MSVTATGVQKAIRTWHDLLFSDGHDTRILLSWVDETATQHANWYLCLFADGRYPVTRLRKMDNNWTEQYNDLTLCQSLLQYGVYTGKQ